VNLGQWLGLICITIALIILWQIRETLLLVFAAVVIATALNGAVRWLQSGGMKRGQAVGLTLILTLLIATLFIGLIVPPFVDQFVQLARFLPSTFTQLSTRLEAQIDAIIQQRPAWIPAPQLPNFSDLAQQIQPIAQTGIGQIFEIFSNSVTALLKVLLVVVLMIMLLSNPNAYRNAALSLFPSFYRRRADDILTKCDSALGNWAIGLLISSSLVAALSAFGLGLLRVEFVLAHALLAGSLNFIPNIGPTISVVFPLLVALQDSLWKAIGVIILYVVIQNVEAYLLTPSVMAKQVSLLPAITLLSQIFFTTFFGFLGLLLAVPLTVVAKTWIDEALVKDVLDQWNNSHWSKRLSSSGPSVLPNPMTQPALPASVETIETPDAKNGTTYQETPKKLQDSSDLEQS
jgi:predicted PurR-regulated permease PerM